MGPAKNVRVKCRVSKWTHKGREILHRAGDQGATESNQGSNEIGGQGASGPCYLESEYHEDGVQRVTGD